MSPEQWRYDPDDRGVFDGPRNTDVVAHVYTKGVGAEGQNECDRRGKLIASAPEMFEALSAIVAWWDDHDVLPDEARERAAACEAAARAALAKAQPNP